MSRKCKDIYLLYYTIVKFGSDSEKDVPQGKELTQEIPANIEATLLFKHRYCDRTVCRNL